MKKTKKIALLVVGILSCVIIQLIFIKPNNPQPDKPKQKEDVFQVNLAKCEKLENEMLTCIAFVEDFHSEPYFCGAKWTIGYGSTVLENGKPVTPRTPAVSKKEAKQLSLFHLRKYVYPFLKYVKRELSDEELLGTVMFIYNIGGESFSGYNEYGQRIQKESSFLTALNKGKKPQDCALRMTGFCASAGKRANGLLKRHWVQGAVFCGILTPQMILELEPAKFYQTKNMGNYYHLDAKRNIIRKDGFYSLNFDENIQKVFLRMNCGKKKTSDIL